MSKLHTFLESEAFTALVKAAAEPGKGQNLAALRVAIVQNMPEQYTVTIGFRPEDAEGVVKKAIQDLQARVMVPGWFGSYPDSHSALERFVANYHPATSTIEPPSAQIWLYDLQAVLDEVRGIRA